MKWNKKGLIYAPNKKYWWNQLYSILPTPYFIKEKNIIRIYYSTTCKERFGRVSFIDVDADNPAHILYEHNDFILDIGDLGNFDDCGVNACTVIEVKGSQFMYYAGYQRHFRTPYSILTGLAVSKDGINFEKRSNVPLWERNTKEISLRSAPTLIRDNGLYKAWYVSGKGWKHIEGELFNGKLMPTYDLKYAESDDGINWQFFEDSVITLKEDEFGFGRPYITKAESGFKLYYSIRRKNVSYRIGFAESSDGIAWVRKDNEIGIDVSETGWDSEMICYPAVITANSKTYLFYNGNRNGETGFGFAELEID